MTIPTLLALLYTVGYWLAVYALAFGVALVGRFVYELFRGDRR